MPSLIDAHTHIMFATVRQATLLTADIGFAIIAADDADTLFDPAVAATQGRSWRRWCAGMRPRRC